MADDIDRAGVAKAYGRWAPVYDLVFGKVFDEGRQSTIAEADKIGGRDSRCRRRHRTVAVGLFAHHETVRRRYFRADAAQGAAARARARAYQCRDAGGDGRQESGVSGCVLRRGGGAICHHRGAGSRSHARRFHPRAEARRRTHSGQSHRRRKRPAPRCSNWRLRRWRAGSAGGRNFRGRGWRIGPRNMAASA